MKVDVNECPSALRFGAMPRPPASFQTAPKIMSPATAVDEFKGAWRSLETATRPHTPRPMTNPVFWFLAALETGRLHTLWPIGIW